MKLNALMFMSITFPTQNVWLLYQSAEKNRFLPFEQQHGFNPISSAIITGNWACRTRGSPTLIDTLRRTQLFARSVHSKQISFASVCKMGCYCTVCKSQMIMFIPCTHLLYTQNGQCHFQIPKIGLTTTGSTCSPKLTGVCNTLVEGQNQCRRGGLLLS